jgi:polyisoprenyl-phosphate glycosyltransferase
MTSRKPTDIDPGVDSAFGAPFQNPAANHDLAAKNVAAQKTVSVVLPVFNEVAVLAELNETLQNALAETGYDFEIVFVNDGSIDGSTELLDEIASEYSNVRVIHFSRNFGHQSALQAGLTAARGDAVIIMDSDLQDGTDAIPLFLAKWEEGFQVVYAIREKRKENIVKRMLFFGFYRLLNAVSSQDIPCDAGNFGLIDRRVANHIVHLPEQSRFYPGLRHWVGFNQCGVVVERHERHDGQPRVSFWGLLRLARTAVFSFSTLPLMLFYAVAVISMVVCMGLTGFTLYHKVFTQLAIPGWASGVITASFFGTLNALGIAVLGEYVVRIFDQVRARPQFIIERTVNMYVPKEVVQEDHVRDSEQDVLTSINQVV